MLRGVANISSSGSSAPVSTTFALLPSPASVTPYVQYFVTDVGIEGSFWYSTSTTWQPVDNQVVLWGGGIPLVMPPSGSIAVTTGALTLGTSIGLTLPNCYMYFPGSAFSGSAAGFYYVTMTSGTAGTVYSNTYTSGIPQVPASPTLVTTGAGSYVAVTAATTICSFNMSANIMGPNGILHSSLSQIIPNTTPSLRLWFNATTNNLMNLNSSASSGPTLGYVQNMGATNQQIYYYPGNGVQSSVDTTAAITLYLRMATGSVTNYSIFPVPIVTLIR